MTWKLAVRPIARLQIAEASEWYDSKVPGLGDRFLDDVEQSLAMVCDNPFQYQTARGDLRRVLLSRFPYLLLYGVVDDEVVVVRCLHGHRDPRRWPDRIGPDDQ